MLFKSLTFWGLVVGIVAFLVRFFVPEFPFDEGAILAFTLFLLGLAGVYPTVQTALSVRGLGFSMAWSDVFLIREFWVLLVGLISFVIFYFFPHFPFGSEELLGLVLFILALFQINPELKERGLR
jgi:hypothetical protein